MPNPPPGDKIYLFDLTGELVSSMEVFEDGRAELDLPELHRRKSKAYASVGHVFKHSTIPVLNSLPHSSS